MSFMRFTDDHGNQHAWRMLDSIPTDVSRGLRHGLFDLGILMRRTANQAILREPKTGRTYFIRGPSGRIRRHRASARRDSAHANLTGALRRSIGWQVVGDDELQFGFGVAARAGQEAPSYASSVEFEPHHRRTLGKSAERVLGFGEGYILWGVDREVRR